MTWRGFHNPDDDIRPLGEGLQRLASRLGTAPPDALGRVAEAWSGVVGDQIAAHATPVAIKRGALIVEVGDKRWATQLKWMTGRIVQALNNEVTELALESIEIRSPRR